MKGRLALAAIFLLGAGCNDPNQTILQWMPDMADAPTVKPQKSYIDPPEGSVSMTAILYPTTPEEAEKLLVMPPRIAQEPGVEERGKWLYETYCEVCHAADAKGQGNRLEGTAFPIPPDLTHPSYVARGDGFFFYRITFGSAMMPSYGYATSPHERWQIVYYLRTLQKAH